MRSSLTATAVLSLTLIAPALPAGAASTSASTSASPTSTQATTTTTTRTFEVRGEIDDISLPNRRIRVDRDRGSDVDVKVTKSTFIRLNGDRVGLRSLDEGDRIYARGVVKNGVRYATFISSEG